ncbi:MAG: hypothetical protein ISS88_02715, partial [Candidatus Portnoybacteria bacterium]|nr:hypothetical protein [Candidatus Portnoybacteria bacterium]
MKRITMVVGMIFLVMAMVTMGCATEKIWSNSYVTGKIEAHQDDINSINDQLKKLRKTDRIILGELAKTNKGIEEIKANFYSEPTAVTAASEEVEKVKEVEKITEASSEPPEEVILLAPLAPILEPKKADLPKKVKFVKTTSDIEQM